MSTFRDMMDSELNKQRARGHYCKSWHEAYGLLAEEFDEFFDEVKKRTSKRDRYNTLKELVQIAALSERIAIDLALVEDFERSDLYSSLIASNGQVVS